MMGRATVGFGRTRAIGPEEVAVEEIPAKESDTEELAIEDLTLEKTRAGCGHETVGDSDSDATSELALSLQCWPLLDSSYFN